jgi:hypothetical protein
MCKCIIFRIIKSLFLLSFAIFSTLSTIIYASFRFEDNHFPGNHPLCHAFSRLQGKVDFANISIANEFKIVAIGDIHGCFDGLIEILAHAKIIDRQSEPLCIWNKNIRNTLLIQLGDVVDRWQ